MEILHTADVHLGSNACRRIGPATGDYARLQDFQRSVEFLVERGSDEDIDFLLF